MDSKGVSRLQAKGTMQAANRDGGAEESPAQLPVSVREIAKIDEARNQACTSGAERNQRQRAPKAGRVGLSPWPPERRPEGGRSGAETGGASSSSSTSSSFCK